ncbi:MAG: hypothetical protein AB7Q16_05965 [Vicinamibacterales bacterium]
MSTQTQTPPLTVVDPEAEYFADPKKSTRIPVAAIHGWIEVRDEISIGEERRVFAGAVKGQTMTKDGDSRMEYDAERVSFGNNVLHIIDWSLKRPLSADALKALRPEIYKAIDAAVQAHIDRVKEGNGRTLPSGSASPTSDSAA